MFGTKPKQTHSSPLAHGDHPELDDSDILSNEEDIKKHQSLIGSLQWAVSIGRPDITTAVMTLSKFRAEPRKGHLERAKRIVGYLMKMKFATIRFRTDIPDLSDVETRQHDWEEIYAPAGTFFNSVFFTNEQTGYIVGSNREILKTEDGGNTWEAYNNAFFDSGYYEVLFTDENTGHIVGGETWQMGYYLSTTDAGAT